ncbi:MAG: phosphatase PAP2 family protein [Ignavibacteria bacterium]|jgi:undecaprenyl-diphosphatase|nr:phosphatase PAP2 family protein [Ignavibacteria bacterium]MDH7527618.1 phosphatase PAP2 family protein [Ignavibacteria bacterium]
MIAAIEKIQIIEDILMQNISGFIFNNKLKRTNWIRNFFIVFTRLGDGFVYPIIIFVMLINSKLSLKEFFVFAAAFSIERIFYFTIKNSIRRLRPFERLKINNIPILPPDRYSFPSGHTSAAFLFATLISIYFPIFTFILFLYAILVGISRIILNLHYPTDVLIGSQLGFSIAMISIELINIIL